MIKFKTINLHEFSGGIYNKCRSSLPEVFLRKASPQIYNKLIKEQPCPKGNFNKVAV